MTPVIQISVLINQGWMPGKPGECLERLEAQLAGMHDPCDQRFFEKQIIYGAIERLAKEMKEAEQPLPELMSYPVKVDISGTINGEPVAIVKDVDALSTKRKGGWPKGKPRRVQG